MKNPQSIIYIYLRIYDNTDNFRLLLLNYTNFSNHLKRIFHGIIDIYFNPKNISYIHLLKSDHKLINSQLDLDKMYEYIMYIFHYHIGDNIILYNPLLYQNNRNYILCTPSLLLIIKNTFHNYLFFCSIQTPQKPLT